MTRQPTDGTAEIDLAEARQTTTITIPRTQHKLVRDLAYDWGFTQNGLIAAAIAVAATRPDEWREVLLAARTANER